MSDTELTELNLFNYPSSVGNDITYAANYALTDTSVTGSINNASPGWYSAGPYSEPVIFFNDIKRTDEQRGVFGEVSFAMSDTTELSIGARWYDILLILKVVLIHHSTMGLVLQTHNNLDLTYLRNMHQVMPMAIQIRQKQTV